MKRAPSSTDLAPYVGAAVVPVAFSVEPRSAPRRTVPDPRVDPSLMTSALALFARLFVPFVMAELRANANTDAEPDDAWIDQTRSPLGRRLHCALARSGALPARKVGRRWLVRCADVSAYIVEHGRAAEPSSTDEGAPAEDDAAAIRDLLASCGETVVAPAATTRPNKARR
jgi:hypothetical protein